MHQRVAVWEEMARTLGADLAIHPNARQDTGSKLCPRIRAMARLARLAAVASAMTGLVRTLRLIPRLWAASARDVIIVCNGGVESLVVLSILRFRGRLLVVDFVDFVPAMRHLSGAARARACCERLCGRLATVCVFVSEEQRRRAVEMGLAKPDYSMWIPYGMVDIDAAQAAEASLPCGDSDSSASFAPWESGWSRRTMRIGWVGALWFYDGHEANDLTSVLRGVALARAATSQAIEVVLGGVTRHDLEALFAPGDPVYGFTSCHGRFRWGSVGHWALLAGCDVLVLPAGDALMEANRAKVYDYMAIRKAIVARETQEMRRVLGDCAIFVSGSPDSWCSGLTYLLSDARLRRRLGECARRRLESRFLASVMAERLTEMCDMLGRS